MAAKAGASKQRLTRRKRAGVGIFCLAVPQAQKLGARQLPTASPLVKLMPAASIDERERNQRVAALVVELGIAARGDDDELLAVDRIGRWGRIDAGAGLEF